MLLNEHDAQLGAQSRGEFLGMTGNSSWWLLGSAGIAVLSVLILWGGCNVPLLPCLVFGLGLCALALLYVFTLKNNRPAHYDTDFFEAILVESGAAELAFGPRRRRPANPFGAGRDWAASAGAEPALTPRLALRSAPPSAESGRAPVPEGIEPPMAECPRRPGREPAPSVPLAAYERLQSELSDTQSQLDDAMSGQEEFA